jgi:Flp pilus assembly protein TadD
MIRRGTTPGAVLVLALAVPVWAQRVEAGERAPAFEAAGLDGAKVAYERPSEGAAKDGDVTILVFVGPTQKASLLTLADLRTYLRLNTEHVARIRCIALASGPLDEQELTSLRDRLPPGGKITAALDPEKKARRAYGVIALPTTFVIGPDGVVVDVVPGRSASLRKRVDTAVRNALGLPPRKEEGPLDPAARKALRLRNLARELIRKRRLEDALAPLAKAHELQPKDVGLILMQGDLLLRLERGEEATAAHRAALALDPESRAAQRGLAKALALGDDLDAAEKALREALTKPPRDSSLYYWLGRVLERKGDHAAAASAYRNAYEQLLRGR